MGFLAALPAIANVASTAFDMFGKKKKQETPAPLRAEIMQPQWQQNLGAQLGGFASKYLDKFKPGEKFTGKLSAGISPLETKGLGFLDQYLGQGPGKMYGLAADELTKTLTGQYDPYKSPYFRSLREGSRRDLEEGIDVARRGQGARGTFFQDTSIREENKLREKTQNFLDQILGGMFEKERARRFEAVPQAMQLEQYERGIPLEKAEAGTRIGALPRLLEQGDLERKYQEFQRQRGELGDVVSTAQGVYGQQVPYGFKEFQPGMPPQTSTLERIMGGVPQLAGGIQDIFGAFGKKKKAGGSTFNIASALSNFLPK